MTFAAVGSQSPQRRAGCFPRLASKAVLLIGSISISGCYSFSTFQSARLLDPGQTSLTPSISRQAFVADGRYDDLWSVADPQVRHGVNSKLDLGIKCARIGIGDGYQFIAIDPKVGIARERLSFSLPIGFFFGDGIDRGDSYQLHPTLLASERINELAELNLALKGIWFVKQGADDFWALNLGARLTPKWSDISFHPELGVLLDPGFGFLWDPADEEFYFQWGVGVAYDFGG